MFREGGNAVEYVANELRSTMVGRMAEAFDRTLKSVADTSFKAVVGTRLERRGYQLLGMNTPAVCDVGLTREMREVRFTSYRPEAEPFLREARNVAARLTASNHTPSNGLRVGRGEALIRVVIPMELVSCEQAAEFIGRSEEQDNILCSGCLAGCLGCCGGTDLIAFDIRMSEFTLGSITNIVDKTYGSPKCPPSYYFTQAGGSVSAKVNNTRAGNWNAENKKYLNFMNTSAEHQYYDSVNLVMMAMYLNRAQIGRYTAVHIARIDAEYINDARSAGDELIYFPPNRDMNRAEEKLEQSIRELYKRQGHTTGLIPTVPASQFNGTPYEGMTVTMSDAQYDELHKAIARAEQESPNQQAFLCGPNITGAAPALNTSHPISWMSGFARHFCATEKEVDMPDGSTMKFVLNKEDNLKKKMGRHEERVWNDKIRDEPVIFRKWLQNHPAFRPDGNPHKIKREEYEAIKGEIMWDEAWGARKVLRACVFPKGGEGSPQTRLITLPGVSAEQAKKHQCASSAIVQTLERFEMDCFGFRKFNGCTISGKALKMARMAAHTSEGYVSEGFDKSTCDRTWDYRKWAKYEEYIMAMAEVLTDSYFYENKIPMFEADSQHVKNIEWRSLYLTIAADIMYYYLMSGINPTGHANSKQAEVGIGAGILQGFGEDHYEQWSLWCKGQIGLQEIPDAHPDFFPHMLGADGISVKEAHYDGFQHMVAGDDTIIKIPILKRTNAEAVTHMANAIMQATNECWVPAFVSKDHLNKHGGPRSCIECLSMVVAQFPNAYNTGIDFCYVPKPIKRADKMAWTLSNAFKIIETSAGKVGVQDAIYFRHNATRCLSMCLEMTYCIWIRWVILKTALYYLNKLRAMKREPNFDKPLYGERTMEGRALPDATGYIGDSLEQAYTLIKAEFMRTDIETLPCMEANCNAWGLEDPNVLADGALLRKTLRQLDEVAKSVYITEEHITDPVSYISLFTLGPLDAVIGQKSERLLKAAQSAERDVLPIEQLRQGLIDSVTAKKSRIAASAQSQPGAASSSNGKGRGALQPSDKGWKATTTHDGKSKAWSHRGGDWAGY